MEKELKAIWVKPNTHKDLKRYCDNNGLKMTFVVQDLINKHIEDVNS